MSQDIQVLESDDSMTSGGTNKTYIMAPSGANISSITVRGSDDGTGSSYSLTLSSPDSNEVGLFGVNSTGDATINLSAESGSTLSGGANITNIAINASFGSGTFQVKTDDSGNWDINKAADMTVQNTTRTDSVTLELPSTESTDAKTTTVDLKQNFSSHGSNVHGGEIIASNDPVTVGQQQYTFTALDGHQSNADGQIDINLNSGGSTVTNPSLLVVEPEDDNDEEHAYTVTPSYDKTDQQVQNTNIDAYTGSTRTTASLESDSDVTAGYDFFGTHTLEDSDDQG
ncbi:MAG: hypothetical protein ABEI97_04475, partial [Candidatus Nanohaloarchaea archaeon]